MIGRGRGLDFHSAFAPMYGVYFGWASTRAEIDQ